MSDSYTAQWVNGFRGSTVLPAQDAQDELEKIRKRSHGELDPQIVVDTVAKSKRHKLRGFFVWDDTAAANAYRLEQARNLIRSIVVVHKKLPNVTARTYETAQSKTSGGVKKTVYKTMEEVMKDPDDRAALLQRALGDLVSIQRKYRCLQELAIVFREIDSVLSTIKV